jgi:hypothetical protein
MTKNKSLLFFYLSCENIAPQNSACSWCLWIKILWNKRKIVFLIIFVNNRGVCCSTYGILLFISTTRVQHKTKGTGTKTFVSAMNMGLFTNNRANLVMDICKLHMNVIVKWLALLLFIREVSSSNSCPEIGCPDWTFCDFPQSLQVNADIVP